MEGVKYYADQPLLLGKAFLRLERDFDKHVHYCRDEPLAQEFLETCDEAMDYFEVAGVKNLKLFGAFLFTVHLTLLKNERVIQKFPLMHHPRFIHHHHI